MLLIDMNNTSNTDVHFLHDFFFVLQKWGIIFDVILDFEHIAFYFVKIPIEFDKVFLL